MRTLILAAAAALALPAAASAQSSPTFPEEMDEDIARSLPHPAEVEAIADVSRDPYLRDRVRNSVDDVAIGMGDVMAQVAVVAPALRRSLADLERNLDRAIYDARRGRDRDYYEDYEYRRR